MRASSALLIAVGVLAPLGAAAQPTADQRAVVMLLDGRGALSGSDAAQHALSRLRRAIGEIGAVAPDRATLATRRDGRVDVAVLSSAAAMRERAEQHFRRLETDAAIRLIEEASIHHGRRFSDVFGDVEAARASRLLAAMYQAEGRPIRMKEELVKAITYAPDLPMDPAMYRPDLVAEYETTRDYLRAAGIPLPGPTRLCEAARLIGAAAVATVAPAATTDASLALDVYDPVTCARRAVTLQLTGDDESARRAASAILVPPPVQAAQTVVIVRPTGPAPIQTPPPEPPTPWFGRWYTLAGAGALVVGGVLAAVVISSQDDPSARVTETDPGAGFNH